MRSAEGRRSRRAAGAWALVASVLAAWCLAAVAVWMGVAPSAGVAGAAGPGETAGPGDDLPAQDRQVVLVGVPGLTWDLLDEAETRALSRLAREGGAAALVVRGTHEVTCSADAWLTVGAGQRAATDLRGCGDAPDEGVSGEGASDNGASGEGASQERASEGEASGAGWPGAGGSASGLWGEGPSDEGQLDERAWRSWQQAAAGRALGPRLGTLADLAEEAGTCVAAYGELAGIGAARPDGSVAVTVPSEPDAVGSPAVGRAGLPDHTCRIHLVSTPEVQDGDRSGQLPVIDAAVDEIAADLPTGATLLVAGLGHTADRAEAQVLITHPVHLRDGAGASLSSGSTRQQGLVQLTDLTPTLLALAGAEHPSSSQVSALAGQVVTATPQVGDHVAQAGELAAGVSAAKMVAPTVLGLLFAIVLPALTLGLLLLWRDRRGRLDRAPGDQRRASPPDPGRTSSHHQDHLVPDQGGRVSPPDPGRTSSHHQDHLVPDQGGRVAPHDQDRDATNQGHTSPNHQGRVGRRGTGPVLVAGVATVAMAVPAATFLAGLVPWWAAPLPTGSVRAPALTLLLLVLGIATVTTALAWAGPWRRHPLGPPAVVAAVTAIVLGVDVIWSARLGLVSVLGLQPVTAGRFYGQGNVGFGILLGCVLVLMAAVLTWLRPRRGQAAAAVLLIGLGATVVNGAPQAGADFGGVPSLVVATGLVALAAAGVRWSWLSLLAVAVAGAVVAALVMVLDWARGPERRTHLGEFVQSVLDGEAVGIVARKLAQSLGILVSYPVAWLVVLALVGVAVVAWRRPRWAAPLEEHAGWSPALRAGVLAMVLGWALNDSGIAAAAAALAMVIAAALTVLGRGDRWQAARPRPDGPVMHQDPVTEGGPVMPGVARSRAVPWLRRAAW